jgi:hypothetical protein
MIKLFEIVFWKMHFNSGSNQKGTKPDTRIGQDVRLSEGPDFKIVEQSKKCIHGCSGFSVLCRQKLNCRLNC